MTPTEVTQAVGVPSRNPEYLELIGAALVRESGAAFDPRGTATMEYWTWTDYWIAVVFDENGIAVGKYLYEIGTQPSLLERLRKWVGM
jgi:hypothetical protein